MNVPAAMAPKPIQPGIPPSRGNSIADTIKALSELDDENQTRALQREVAVALAAHLDARAREAEAVEAAIEAKRKPFAAQTERVDNLVKRFAEFSALAGRVVELFRDDILISKFGVAGYSNLPRPRGSHVAIERTFRVPRVLATQEVLAATKLHGHWPPRFNDYSVLERPHFEEDDDQIIRPLRALINSKPAAESDVDAAIARAQAMLLAEYNKAVRAIEDLLRLDATITAEDRALKYPDGAYVFDEEKFPSDWLIGRMSQRIKLPSLNAAMAAE